MRIGRGTTIAGRYRLERPLGSGGMSVVWLAADTRLGREVAVKVLSETLVVDPDFVRRFEREAQIAAGLSHPALVPVHDLGIAEERPFLVMEYVEGETLGDRLERDPAGIDVGALATEMLGALEHIHEAGIIHRDVKPDNILYADSGRIRLTDFGIARTSGASELTQTGQVLGTLRYMSPESREGAEPTPASDLYSLGVVLADCAERSGAGADLERLIGRMRAADPEQRPVSARAALRALRELGPGPAAGTDAATRVLDGPADPAPPPPESPAEPPSGRQMPADAAPTASTGTGLPRLPERLRGPAIAAIVAVAGIVLIVALLGSDSEDGAERRGAGQAGGGGAKETTTTSAETGNGGAEQPPETAPAADGAALNQQGYDLIQAGRPDEAVPVLEQAVAALEDQPEDITYAYALFNYGQALRMSGRAEEAIPVLERRLEFNNQRDVVRAELKRARREANG